MQLRILHVIDSLRPGGTENGLVNVARQLLDRVDTHVACLRSSGSFAERLPKPQQVYVMDKSDRFSPGAALRLHRAIRRIRPDVIHTHNLGPLIYATMATGLGRLSPILHGEHGQIQEREQNSRRRMQRKLLYRCCKGLHTVSHSMIEALQTEGLPTTRMKAIPNGVDTEHYLPPPDKAAAKLASGLPAEALVIGIVGRFVALKRHTLLLEAFARLATALPNLHLLIVGDGGDDQDTVRAAIEGNTCRQNILWPGMQSQLVQWYQAMDMLVAPSVIEGLSNVILEAMACGVPVLAHEACGSREVIEHELSGYCDNLTTTDDLTQALARRLADLEDLRRTGEAARSRVVDHFSIDSMATGYHKMYEQCAA
jgi:glycosyltransferase involved in cell wall biosynthesis